MVNSPLVIRSIWVSAILLGAAPVLRAAPTLEARIDVLSEIAAGSVDHVLGLGSLNGEGAKELWQFQPDGQLRMLPKGESGLATKESYGDFHLVMEFKWGDKTLTDRETKARDAGLWIHLAGEGSGSGVEVVLREGCLGDLKPVGVAAGAAFVDGEFVGTRSGASVWKAGAPRQRVFAGVVQWSKHDPSWMDRKGFRGREDLESPPGEWNRVEVVAQGGHLKCLANGVLVNEAMASAPAQGRVALRSGGAEMVIRRFELHPLGVFQEKWNAIQASGGTDVSVRAGQEKALSPLESLEQIHLDGPYEAQLVAAEPLVLDPVECTWDAKGRMFVADMRDYPLGPKNAGDPWLSRIQMLTDEDGDGRMDKAVTFADHLDHVQGLLPYKDGLIVTTRTQILFLRDTDGDGVADVLTPLISGFNPRFSQLQVSAPRWGPDGWVHFNNGLDGKEIYPFEKPEAAVGIPRSNFRWDPRTGRLEPVSGFGQYGASFDDFGRYFFCTNRNPVVLAVMPLFAVQRNPLAGLERGWEDIAPFGPDTRVFPMRVTHTTADAHAGTNTACSGLGVYRGHLMPELKNNVFVPDPTGQLVTRYKVEPDGAGFKAARVGEHTEFFRSGDEWCRPVNFTTGPDGAIYICDIYRRWIDHARFFPEDFVKSHDMREGEAQGRIWRIVPKGMKVPKAGPAPSETGALRDWLKHPNAWQRETAQRLLAERGEPWSGSEQAQTPARQLFFNLLNEPDADPAEIPARVSSRAAALAGAPEDAWLAKAVLSSSLVSAGRVLAQIVGSEGFTKVYSAQRAQTLQSLACASAAGGGEVDFEAAVNSLLREAGRLTWWKAAVIQGLSEGLPKAPSQLWGKTLGDFAQKKEGPLGAAALETGVLVKAMDRALSEAGTPPELRLACLSLLGQRKWEDAQPVLKQLLRPGQEPALQAAAMVLLKRFGGEKAGTLVYELLPKAGPALRRDLVVLLCASPKTAIDLFRRMERGEFSPALVDVETRWRYQRGAGELRDLAVKLFGQPSEDRAAVVGQYGQALHKEGDAGRGRQLFEMACTSCHRHGNVGVEVGPSLSDVKVKPPEALLSDILDPNRMFEARYSAYQVETADGRVMVGLVSAENAESVTLTVQGGGREVIPRNTIRLMKALDRSLMPPGMEAVISVEQMSDLLSFLRQP